MEDEITVIKVGGSLLSPSMETLFDFDYSQSLITLLKKHESMRFILIAGGGKLSRYYQRHELLKEISNERKHWLGIAAINMNAEVLYSLAHEDAYPQVLRYEQLDSDDPISFNEKFLISAAGAPGHSSDYNAFRLAKRVGATQIISLSNVDGVYTSDPSIDQNAKMLEELRWEKYLEIIGNPSEHVPGTNYPIDPIAARYANEHGLALYTIEGRNMVNLENVVTGEEFVGTKIV